MKSADKGSWLREVERTNRLAMNDPGRTRRVVMMRLATFGGAPAAVAAIMAVLR